MVTVCVQRNIEKAENGDGRRVPGKWVCAHGSIAVDGVGGSFLLASAILQPGRAPAITFSNQAGPAGVANEGAANGAAFGDYDGDGWPDLLVARLSSGEAALLYRNLGDGSFTPQTDTWPAVDLVLGGVFVDLEPDGDLDLYLVRFTEENQFMRNEGDGFAAIESPAEMRDNALAAGAIFGDFDADGRIDLFSLHRSNLYNQYFTAVLTDDYADASDRVSSLRSGRDTYSAVAFDYDSDGDQDIYVCNNSPNLLHSNQGDGSFDQIARQVGLREDGSGIAGLPGDYDNDGVPDLYVLTAQGSDVLYRNLDGERFDDVTSQAGLEGSEGANAGAWADFDNDGDLDLLVNRFGDLSVWRNDDNRFSDITSTALGADLEEGVVLAGISVADYDRDGDVDAFVAGTLTADVLLRNDTANAGHWLAVDLEWRDGASTHLGARVSMRSGGGSQTREVTTGSFFGSAHGNLLHLGTGSDDHVDELIVEWPSGAGQVLKEVQADQTLTLSQPLAARDLRLARILQPTDETGWGEIVPEVEVTNAGSESVDDAVLSICISYHDTEMASATVAIPMLQAGETIRMRGEAWHPRLSGTHEVAFTIANDDIPGNNSRRQQVYLHRFDESAARLGIAGERPGFAAAFTDYDNDGDLDLYVSNGGWQGDHRNSLFRNDGEAGFFDATSTAGVGDEGNGTGVVSGDFDRDGQPDLYVANGGFTAPNGQQNRYYHNNGDGTFSDQTRAAGLDVVRSSYAAVAGDYDRDGNLDLFVAEFRNAPNTLYHNAGDGTFVDVTLDKRIVTQFSASGSAAIFADYDNDGDLDLYHSLFGSRDWFYFDDGEVAYNTASFGTDGQAAGMTVGDYEGDGDLDIYVVNIDGRSSLYRSEVEQQQRIAFTDVASESGVENLAAGNAGSFLDFDNDGDLDLFVVNSEGGANRAYVNLGDGTFLDRAASFGMAAERASRSVLPGDIDGDGDVDLYVVNDDANFLYENGGSQHAWLSIAVSGIASNRDGIGARITAHFGDHRQIRDVDGTVGFSQGSREAQFGLAAETRVDSLTVAWPSGRFDVLRDLEVNHFLEVVEGGALTSVEEIEDQQPGTFDLEPNFPNPFNAATRIRFTVPSLGGVTLTIYNSIGQVTRVLVDDELPPGRHTASWDGRGAGGEPLASGVYYSQLSVGSELATRSLVLLQ